MAKIRRIGASMSSPTTAQAQAIAYKLQEHLTSRSSKTLPYSVMDLGDIKDVLDFILEQQKQIQKAVDFITQGGHIGSGEDPVGFLVCSYQERNREYQQQQKRIEAVLGRLEVVEQTTLKNTDWGYHEYIWKTLISDIRKRLEAE